MASGSSAAEAPYASARTAIAAVFPIRFISGGLLYGPCYTVSITAMETLELPLELYDLVSDPEIRRAGAKTLIGFRGCSKSTMASLALVLWAALEHPDRYPFVIMLADTRGLVPRQRPALGRRAHRGNWLHTDGL